MHGDPPLWESLRFGGKPCPEHSSKHGRIGTIIQPLSKPNLITDGIDKLDLFWIKVVKPKPYYVYTEYRPKYGHIWPYMQGRIWVTRMQPIIFQYFIEKIPYPYVIYTWHIWPYMVEKMLTQTSSETLGFVRKSGWLSARGHLARICVLHRRAISWWKCQKWSWWDRNRYWHDWSSNSFYAPILGIILLKTHRYHRPFHIALAAFWFCEGFKIAHR